MLKTRISALCAALVLTVAASAKAQSANETNESRKEKLVAWCKNHPAAKSDCKEIRRDTRDIRADKKEAASDRRDLRADKRDRRGDVRELRKDRRTRN